MSKFRLPVIQRSRQFGKQNILDNIQFASTEDYTKFEQDVLIHGTAYADSNGKHVPLMEIMDNKSNTMATLPITTEERKARLSEAFRQCDIQDIKDDEFLRLLTVARDENLLESILQKIGIRIQTQ